MGKKPTYEELEQRVKELERESLERKGAKRGFVESEETARALLDATYDSAFLIDLKGILVTINEDGAKRLGANVDELIGKCIYDFFPPDVAESRRARCDVVIRSKKPLHFEDERRGMIFDTCLYPVFDEQGEVQQIAVVAHEITEQKQMKKAWSNSEAQKQAILDASVDRIRLVDKDMKIIWANKTTTKQLKIPPEESVGHICYEVLLGRTRPCPGCPTKKALKSHQIEHAVIHHPSSRRRRGEVYVDNYAIPIEDESGNIVNLIQITRDITRQKKAENALKEREKELRIKKNSLEEVNAALRVLVRNRDEDKKEIEEKIMINVNQLVLPHLEKLKKTPLNSRQLAYLGVLESNLNDVVSPFSGTLSSKFLSLTPMEIQVANLVKVGKSTQEAAEMMNLSRRTVESHRDSVRRKLGIKNKKANLRSHLLSI